MATPIPTGGIKWEYIDELSRKLVEAVLSGEGSKVICTNVEPQFMLRPRLWLREHHDLTLIWVDRARHLRSLRDVFDAFDAGMRWYWDHEYYLASMDDYFWCPYLMEPNGVVLYLSQLDELAEYEPEAACALVKMLAGHVKYWAEQTEFDPYFFKVILKTQRDWSEHCDMLAIDASPSSPTPPVNAWHPPGKS